MKALVLKQYGSVANLTLQDVDIPTPKKHDVLIKVHASSVNDWDWSIIRGTPFYIRLMCGLFKPSVNIPGVDVAGEVVAVGSSVTRFKVGDAVYGDLSECDFGAFAEYVCAPETQLAIKPGNLTYVQAAALPHAALLAWQGLLQAGLCNAVAVSGVGIEGIDTVRRNNATKRLLINGAGGGMGTLAIQLAQYFGVKNITCVDSAQKLTHLSDLGCSQVIDYHEVDFTEQAEHYSAILDPKTNRSVFHCARALAPHGRYVTVGGDTKYLLQTVLSAAWIRRMHNKQVSVLALKPNRGLDFISFLCEEAGLTPLIDGPYSLIDSREAISRFGRGEHLGKVVITFDAPA